MADLVESGRAYRMITYSCARHDSGIAPLHLIGFKAIHREYLVHGYYNRNMVAMVAGMDNA